MTSGSHHASDVQPALGLVGARPAALAAGAGLGAGRAADRLVALVVQRVVGQVALVDALPEVALGPVGERVVLPDRRACRRTRRAARRRASADCSRRMPVIHASAPASARSSAATLASPQQCSGPVHGAGSASSTSTCTPKRSSKARHVCERLGEEHAGVDRDDARVRRDARAARRAMTDSSFWKEHRKTSCSCSAASRSSGSSRQTAHSPSPRCTTNGTLRSQSMNVLHRARGRTRPAAPGRGPRPRSALVPTRSAKALNSSPSSRSRLVDADPALDRLGHALGRQADLQALAVDDLAALVVAARCARRRPGSCARRP